MGADNSEKGKVGRPRVMIDPQMLLRYLQIYPTKEQTADFFGCSPDHVNNECKRIFECDFSTLRERASYGKKRALLGWAEKYARRGDAHLIKFLMKNINKFTENPETELSGNQVIELRYSINKKTGPDENVDNEQKQLTAGDARGEAKKGE